MYVLLEAGNSENRVIAVKNEGMEIIKIPYYFNSFHNSNIYFKVDEVKSLDKVNSDILDRLCSYFGKSIQIMISSNKKDVANVLENLGFKRKRACYEVEVTKADYCLYEKDDGIKLITAHKGSKEFMDCAELMLERYMKTHLKINPWTGKRSDFLIFFRKKLYMRKRVTV